MLVRTTNTICCYINEMSYVRIDLCALSLSDHELRSQCAEGWSCIYLVEFKLYLDIIEAITLFFLKKKRWIVEYSHTMPYVP